MSEAWKRWEGQTVNGEFPLLRYFGGSDHSAVFLTERRATPQKAAIKLIPADPANAESQLRRWEQSRKLAHPRLIRVFEAGRCELEGTPLLYFVMEAAEEDLSQILPERPLSPAEVREMLPPVLDALAHIFSNGLVHGRLRPSNILAAGDQVRVSSDSLRGSGELLSSPGSSMDGYDPPEAPGGKLTPAADVWSLAITLVEALTQRRPTWDPAAPAPPSLPEGMPEPFLEIARRCLQVDPQQRWTVSEIAEQLRPPKPVPEKPAAPASRVPEVKRKSTPWRYVLPLAAAALVAAIVMTGNKTSSPSPSAHPVEPQLQQSGPSSDALPEPSRPPREPKPSPAARAKTSSAGSDGPSQGEVVKGAVLQQVLPRVSPSARETIEGKIRVRVRVEVDSSGNVTQAALVSPGPSKYFARLALEAAREWKFTPPRVRGQAVASQWSLRFGFRRTDTDAVSAQTAP